MLIYPRHRDPECQVFLREYNEIIRQCDEIGQEFKGILRNDKLLGFCFIAQGKSKGWSNVIRTLIAEFSKDYPEVENLRNACLLRMKQHKIQDRVVLGFHEEEYTS